MLFDDTSRQPRRTAAVLVVATTALLWFAADTWGQDARNPVRPVYGPDELSAITPTSPNPYVAFLPEGVEPDWTYWNSWMAVERQRRVAARAVRPREPITAPDTGLSLMSPHVLANFGTDPGQNNEVTLSGATGFVGGLLNAEPIENNGSIVVAPGIPLVSPGDLYVVSGVIGNGAFGESGLKTGDFDFYRIDDVPAGRVIDVAVDARNFGSALNPGLALYNSAGGVLATTSNDLVVQIGAQTVIVNRDASLRVTVPAFGDYYVAVFGEPEDSAGSLLANPFNAQTGPGFQTEGAYDLYVRLLENRATKAENNGSLNLATVVPPTGGVYTSTLGDGPFGLTSGDFDFYALQNLQQGDLLVADIDAFAVGSTLDSFVTVWDSTGQLVAWSDDDPFNSFLFTHNSNDFFYLEFDSFVAFEVPANGTYYVAVGAHGSPYPTDPFNSASGLGDTFTGTYELALYVQPHNPAVFAMDLKAGDVIGADLDLFKGNLELLDPSGARIVASLTNLGSIYASNSPLPFDGPSALAYVIPEDGRYFMRYSTFRRGHYLSNLSAFRPALEDETKFEPRQRLFIDFDGVQNFDNSVFPGSHNPKVVDITGLAAALPGWGLDPTDEDAVIDAILEVVQETLKNDLVYPRGNNPLFDIEILNSRDHPDPWGDPDVSRVIVGGTISQLGIATIGIAQSIDVGNFDTTETGIVLLDFLSAAATNPNSLNGIPRGGGASIVDVIGVGVGNIVAHEAGHFFGDFHTENFITAPNIMDQGGDLLNTIGVGPDNTFGTADDIDVDFGVDQYEFLEGFTGFEDTLNIIALGLPAPPGSVLYVNFNRPTNGVGTLALPFNNATDAVNQVPSGGIIRIFPGASNELFTDGIGKKMTIERAGLGPGSAIVGNN